ncbi:Nif3-like dinuclear metal center hexameric protein [Lentzea sp. NBRC 102530]|uniref:Nif3-like dinuclear metal center hexameric protein n=1 Tax=Lentzea sp. NBRC 102530 TaxID=3032201 RepID=UPI0024A48BF0|nr:Nif3-like dinuclear metal center hexameric protein [Lentzea sp. NBRC 102530]GLY54717.1 GTP cyclohydrolase 1 type 2 [Lentzea sp. NBRC 102530]
MKLADVIAVLESAYPPKTAEKWDAVGLVCGDPGEEVSRILVCVDPTASTVDEAVETGAQLLLAHHPLLLRGVNGVPADDPKGSLVHKLIRNGGALYCAHTNADSALPGVSDALARAIGLTVTGPLDPAEPGAATGIGRVGVLPEPEPLRVFAQRVANALPATVQGVRAAGDPERLVSRVAVCGGAGDGYLGAVRDLGVDAYVTADLRHHPASEHLESGGPALVDVAHWASEWPWCEQAAEILRQAFGGRVDVLVSTRRTDPWTVGATSPSAGGHA